MKPSGYEDLDVRYTVSYACLLLGVTQPKCIVTSILSFWFLLTRSHVGNHSSTYPVYKIKIIVFWRTATIICASSIYNSWLILCRVKAG